MVPSNWKSRKWWQKQGGLGQNAYPWLYFQSELLHKKRQSGLLMRSYLEDHPRQGVISHNSCSIIMITWLVIWLNCVKQLISMDSFLLSSRPRCSNRYPHSTARRLGVPKEAREEIPATTLWGTLPSAADHTYFSETWRTSHLGPCQPLQESPVPRSNILKLLLILSIFIICIDTLHDALNNEWNNKFVKHHQAIAQLTNLTNCWLCTHSPISANSMPYLAIPLSLSEPINISCNWLQINPIAAPQAKWGNVSVALHLMGYASNPG